jgi:NAD(P)-dependent dehydrogenase (short-subunit alcohol dehydrogenase family)
MGLLDKKIAIVTGGGGGIGAATAKLMAHEGASVVVADIDGDAAESIVAEISAAGGEGAAITVDVSVEDQVAAMVKLATERYGGVDVLHNNAALVDPKVLSRDKTVVDMDSALWDRVMTVNVRGAMLGCKYAIPAMLARGGGSILMTSSVGAQAATGNQTAYGVSKGAVESLVRYVAVGFGKSGIRCNAIAPGVILTDTAKRVLSTEFQEMHLRTHLSPRLGSPLDIASMAVFLASDRAEYITGTVIPVHGGMTCYLPHQIELWSLEIDPFRRTG